MLIVNARFLTQQLTGVQRFAIEISKQLKQILGKEVVFVCPKNIKNQEVAQLLQPVIVGKQTGYLWEQVELPLYLKQQKKPHLLNLCGMAPVFYKNKSVVLHDIIFVRYPQMFNPILRRFYNLVFPTLLRNSKHIFSVSNFSVEDIAKYYGIGKEKMSVVYNAPSEMFVSNAVTGIKEEKYVFAVSSVKENKNFKMVLESFEHAQTECKDLKLYIAGSMKAKQFKTLNLSQYKENNNIVFLGHISDRQLISYYSNALCLLFPSLYEGFGLPIIEAQACGCPVICSNTSSLPEVAGDSAILCNPYDKEEISGAIRYLYNSQEKAEELRQKGYENSRQFSWSKSAMTIVNTIKSYS